MGIFDSISSLNMGLLGPSGGLASLVGLGDEEENLMSKIPVVNELTGARSNTEKELAKKQKEMAADFKRRQRINERARMNKLGQQLLAFAPQNQMMAQMFGPEAAFSPQQMGAMAANPMDPQAQAQELYARMQQGETVSGYQDAKAAAGEDQRRRASVEAAFAPTGPGPAPLQKVKPQAARRY